MNQEIFDNLKQKSSKPKVYALLLKCKNGSFLMMEAAYSFEDAFTQAKDNFHKMNPRWDLSETSVTLFTQADVSELMKPFFADPDDAKKLNVKHVKPDDNYKNEAVPVVAQDFFEGNKKKNALMKEIVDTSSKELLELNKQTFNDVEYAYLTNVIKNNKKQK